MKKLIFLFLAVSGLYQTALADCPTKATVEYADQYSLNNFPNVYKDCEYIPGNVYIHGSGITSLAGLGKIRGIGGYLFMQPILQACKDLRTLSLLVATSI